MASTQHSPVMVEQPSSPLHPFTTPDLALSTQPESTSHAHTSSPSLTSSPTMSETRDPTPTAEHGEHQDPPPEHAPVLDESTPDTNDGDDSSTSESHSESSTSTETPGTISTPRSSAHDSGQPIPDSSASQLSSQNPDELTEGEAQSQPQPETSSNIQDDILVPPSDPPVMPPPPIEVDMPIIDMTPDWVKHDEDTSTPDAEELKEIDADKNELDATNTAAVETAVFTHLDDPDLRPCKKIRLSWLVKGVRGTKERPNRARIMTSPSVQIDGKYWNIKFFPRGNKSRNSLAAFVRCSPTEPEAPQPDLRGSFKCYEASPETDLSKLEPVLDLKLTPPEVLQEECSQEKESSNEPPLTVHNHDPPRDEDVDDDDEDDDDSVSGDEDDPIHIPINHIVTEDFRVSAQLGLVIYNPEEPRTCYTSSVSHQFYPQSDEWGRDPIVSQYEEIHRRKRGQRQALLRNDTLVIDAYIRIYDDPTKALFWDFAGEAQWDAKGLAGFFPMGTRLLYHSPATAGITAYALLAPFRKAIQRVEAGAWRSDSAVRPRPLIAHLQLMLFQMRHMKKEELYVHLDSVIHEITRSGESFDNVNMFWETFRRSIEIEAEADSELVSSFEQVYGSREFARKLPLLPVKDVTDFQDSATQAFQKAQIKEALPNFLPLTLQRQSFDTEKRQWRLHNDRVRISEEIDLSAYSTDGDANFTLYGLIVHDGDRTSGKFFSVLRPTGPGGKWLVFSDGSGNKVFSYTKKRITAYEGLDPPELKKSTSSGQTMHSALYIRTSCLQDYLPGKMEPFQLPLWLKPHLDERYNYSEENFETAPSTDAQDAVEIQIFWDKIVGGQEGKLDLYKLKNHPKARSEDCKQHFTADREASISQVHGLIASQLGIDEGAFKLWGMNYNRLGGVSKGYMGVLRSMSAVGSCLGTSKMLTLWLTVVPCKHDLGDEALATNFKSIGGKHVEAPPKPAFDLSKSPRLLPEEEQDEIAIQDILGDSTVTATTSTLPTGESNSALQEASADDSVLPSSTTEESDVSSEDRTIGTVDEQLAAADAEQDSVREAVEHSVQTISSSISPTMEVVEIEGTHSAAQTQLTEAAEVQDTQITTEPWVSSQSNIQPTARPTVSAQRTPSFYHAATLEQSEETDNASSVEPTTDSEAQPVQAVTPEEISVDEVMPPPLGRGSSSEDYDNSTILPVVHGHLFEASSHEASSLPIGIPLMIGNERIILLSPNQEELSEADAALITSMIAVDIEAAERLRQDGNGESGDDEADRAEMIEVDSRPSTPRQRVADVYGFLHVFDAEKQDFTAHSTFMVPGDTTISAMVRTQLAYDDERSFHMWKRDGTYRTTGVSLESTFVDVSLSDCCEIIVGDHLGEKKMEALRGEAKYIDPGQLMRYLAMVQRGHPTLARTSTEAVEISEFGSDYYKGSLVRGQRHGQQCSIITQSGDRYEGPLVAGQKSGGKGRMTYQNGDVYDGGWLDDQKHGQGESVEKRTGNRYVGGYENDKRWGKGVTYWEVADQQAALCQVCYFEEVDALFYRCGHVVACYACAKQCASDSNGCPVCRRPIEAVVRMYRS